jgi:hypothetical protein
VGDDEQDHHLAGDGHEELSADGGLWKKHGRLLMLWCIILNESRLHKGNKALNIIDS